MILFTVRSEVPLQQTEFLFVKLQLFIFPPKKQEEMILNLNTNSAINQRTAEALCRWVEKIRIYFVFSGVFIRQINALSGT